MSNARGDSSASALALVLLALVAQMSQLALTHAGNLLGYQHFLPLQGTSVVHYAARAVLLAQVLVVVYCAFSRRRDIAQFLRALLPGWRLPVAAAAFALSSATLARVPADYVLELVLASLVQLAQLATIAFAVAALPAARASAIARVFDRALGGASDAIEPGTFDRFVILAALWTVAVSYLLAVVSYQRQPHVPDEVVYLMHARYFAQGMLSMVAPPLRDAFDVDLRSYEPTRWFSPVPPGWPAMLAVGARVGAPWLVNPVLGGINVILTYALSRELYSRRTSRLIVVLLAASPWALFMAMNLMTHTFTLTCALLAALGVARVRRGATLAWAVIGGVALGVISLIRPLEAAAAAGLLGLWSLRARWRGMPLVPSALLTLSAAIVGLLNLPYNKALTGNSRTFPIMVYTDKLFGPETNALGFGASRGLGWSGLDPYPGHGLRDVLVNMNLNITQVNFELLGWSCGSMLAIIVLLAARRITRADWCMVAAVTTIVVIHAFYWFSGGPDFAARYWFLILVPMLALAARGVETVDAALFRCHPARSEGSALTPDVQMLRHAQGGALHAAAAFTLLALMVFVPWRGMDKYHHYRGMRPDVRVIAAQKQFGNSLVLVRGKRHPDYHSAAVYNPIDLRAAQPIYAWDRGADSRARVLDAYPNRPVWILDGPSVTRDSFHVSGPFTAEQVRALP